MHDRAPGSAPFLTEEDTASQIGISAGTLRNWRSQGRGPRWVKNPDTGRFFGYTQQAVDEWLARAVEESAS